MQKTAEFRLGLGLDKLSCATLLITLIAYYFVDDKTCLVMLKLNLCDTLVFLVHLDFNNFFFNFFNVHVVVLTCRGQRIFSAFRLFLVIYCHGTFAYFLSAVLIPLCLIDGILDLMIVLRIRRKIIRTVLCCVVYYKCAERILCTLIHSISCSFRFRFIRMHCALVLPCKQL